MVNVMKAEVMSIIRRADCEEAAETGEKSLYDILGTWLREKQRSIWSLLKQDM